MKKARIVKNTSIIEVITDNAFFIIFILLPNNLQLLLISQSFTAEKPYEGKLHH